MINSRFLWREMLGARRQAAVFILCVALSITSLVAVNSFRRDVHLAISGDARALHGGDVIVHSHYDFSPGLLSAVNGLGTAVQEKLRTWEFYSVVRSEQETSLFANILAVEPGYPLYGEVVLDSGKDFVRQLRPGGAIVARDLLVRLELEVGDILRVGKASLVIVDVVERESTRPVDVFNFGPRVFVAAADLDSLDLVRKGSRVEYELLLRLAEDQDLEATAARLGGAAIEGQERVATYRNARSGLKRFFDNLLFFLSLISIFTLLLAGIGMQSSLAALLAQKEKSIGIIRALGATRRFLFTHYLLLVLLYGFVGSCLGVAAGMGVKWFLPTLFAGMIGPEYLRGLGVLDILEGMVTGFFVVSFFTFLPLYRLREVKPIIIFRQENGRASRGTVYYLALAAGLVLLTLLVIRQLEEVKTGIYFVLGAGGLILVVTLLARLALLLLARMRIARLTLRQAQRSLLRPGNSTRPVVVTLASALSVLLAIFLVEYNLHGSYVSSYPPGAPNLFVIDIQPQQRDDVRQLLGEDVQLHPIIRARLRAINDEPVKRGERRSRFSDTLTREFSLTYRDSLLDDEVVLEGGALYRPGTAKDVPLQVSILDTVAEMGDMRLGDILEFNIQGVQLKAEVTSIRGRTKSMLYPFFYFVFPSKYLEKAPQTLFAAVHVDKESIGGMQKRLVAAYPNVSIVNVAETAEQLGEVMGRLSMIVTFFSLFSILAGTLIIISSVLATRLERVREAVYYSMLGGRSRFVISVFLVENVVLGLVSSLLAVVLAQGGSWALCHYLFDIQYDPAWIASLALVVATLALVVAVGMISSWSIIRQKPIAFLREQTGE